MVPGSLAKWMVVAAIPIISNRDVSSQVRVEQGRTGQASWHLLLEGEASLVQTSSGPCTESFSASGLPRIDANN